MKSFKSGLVILGSIGLFFMAACSNQNQGANPNNNSVEVNPTESASKSPDESKTEASNKAGVPQAGGQVIESGLYHLEFVPVKETKGTHLDFYLQKGDNHEAIPNAKVTAQVQLPDGTQKSIPLTYDAEGKHYAAVLPSEATGEYKVAILSEINGEKVNGRFTFNR